MGNLGSWNQINAYVDALAFAGMELQDFEHVLRRKDSFRPEIRQLHEQLLLTIDRPTSHDRRHYIPALGRNDLWSFGPNDWRRAGVVLPEGHQTEPLLPWDADLIYHRLDPKVEYLYYQPSRISALEGFQKPSLADLTKAIGGQSKTTSDLVIALRGTSRLTEGWQIIRLWDIGRTNPWEISPNQIPLCYQIASPADTYLFLLALREKKLARNEEWAVTTVRHEEGQEYFHHFSCSWSGAVRNSPDYRGPGMNTDNLVALTRKHPPAKPE